MASEVPPPAAPEPRKDEPGFPPLTADEVRSFEVLADQLRRGGVGQVRAAPLLLGCAVGGWVAFLADRTQTAAGISAFALLFMGLLQWVAGADALRWARKFRGAVTVGSDKPAVLKAVRVLAADYSFVAAMFEFAVLVLATAALLWVGVLVNHVVRWIGDPA